MARSNNQDRTGAPTGPPTGRPLRPGQPVDHGLPWSEAGAGQPGYDAHGQAQGGHLPWPPQSQPPMGQGPQGYPQQGYPQQAGYAPDPQFGQYLPQGGQPPGYPTAQPYQDPAMRGSYAPSETGYAPNQGGYPAPGHDQQGYDFGAYATQPGGYQVPTHNPSGRALPAPPPPQGYAPPYAQPQPGQPAFEQGFGGQQPHAGDDDFEDEDDYDEPRRFGFLKIAATLVFAIAVGGGGAVAYKMYGGKLLGGSAPVVMKADATPAKLRPQDGSSAVGERLDGGTVPAVVPSGDAPSGDAPAGARRVQTVTISPPGTASAEPPMRPTISMPGLTIAGGAPAQPSASAPPPAPQQRTVTQPPVQPSALGRAAPQPVNTRVATLDPPVVAPAPAAKPEPKKVAVAKATKADDSYKSAAVATAATAQTSAPSAAPAKSGGNGYVAALFSSQGSAIAARKELDALQAKYTDLLGDKSTDVTEVTVNGQQWYRAIVGPPGSREAVNTLCGQLKAAGQKDCRAVAY